jgi:hypothetical protein
VSLDERPRGSTWPTSKVHYNSLSRTSIEGALVIMQSKLVMLEILLVMLTIIKTVLELKNNNQDTDDTVVDKSSSRSLIFTTLFKKRSGVWNRLMRRSGSACWTRATGWRP